MFSKLRAIATNTDLMTMVAIAAVGWGLTQLSKAVQDRQESVGALTNQAAVLGQEIAKREQYLADLQQYEANLNSAVHKDKADVADAVSRDVSDFEG
jgi:ABC-type transporter Mla subunit MlaD